MNEQEKSNDNHMIIEKKISKLDSIENCNIFLFCFEWGFVRNKLYKQERESDMTNLI